MVTTRARCEHEFNIAVNQKPGNQKLINITEFKY